MSDVSSRQAALVGCIREIYGSTGFIPLHAPIFGGNEKKYLADCIDTTYVSSVGAYVDRFESMMRELTGAKYAIATMNGTAALHIALVLAGVKDGDEVITQPLSFVATCNAIAYQRAHAVFVDVDRDTLGLSPRALEEFLEQHARRVDGSTVNRTTGRRIAAVVPMHTFGHPCRIGELKAVCDAWGLVLIEDAAESLGSRIAGVHTGRTGLIGAFSFNGNKIATSGGGGCIVTDDDRIGRLAKHLTTTAKQPHQWEFFHDQIGYNYRLPNLNAALACAQLEQLPAFVRSKRVTSARYRDFCARQGISFVDEPAGTESNFWLNAVLWDDLADRDRFLEYSNAQGVMTRPVWTLLFRLPAFADCPRGPTPEAEWIESRLVNIPSSVIP